MQHSDADPSRQNADSLAAASAPSYSTTEVARLLNVSTQTVQKWVDLGHLAAWKTLGGHRRISVESVKLFVTSQTVPAAQQASRPAREATPGQAALPVKILLVDDDPFQLDLLQAMLSSTQRQFDISTASNGFDALLQVGRRMPDILITDIVMAGMDGIEMLRSLHQNVHSAKLPTIAISSYSADEVLHRGGLPEGVEFIPKPIDRQRLLKAIEDFLAASAGEQAHPAS